MPDEQLLRIITPEEMPELHADPVDEETLEAARAIVGDVRKRGEAALREYAEYYGDVPIDGPLIIPREEMEAAKNSLSWNDRKLLIRTADRIRRFALAQLESLKSVEIAIPGGVAGQEIAPVERAGCYAPGGRFPLPSTVLMTAVTARVAGVSSVWVASPKPAPVTLAAAAVAGVNGFLAVGGAQGIAALAHGAGTIPPCDVVVGPGNKFVTAAKKLIFGNANIDMLAGPSELTVLADWGADPGLIAADLLAQAEHDPDALPILVATVGEVAHEVNEELAKQLSDLPTAETARAALNNGFAIVAGGLDKAIELCNYIAPEHLALHVEDTDHVAPRCLHYGALFIGAGAAEVLADYGAGPNHTLPTGGTARHSGGLSVFDFVRVRTWMRMRDLSAGQELVRDTVRLAELEGLAAHARSAARRFSKG